MPKRSAPATLSLEPGKPITLGDLRLLVGWCEAEADETVVRGTTFVEWNGNPRVKTLTVNVGEVAS